MKVAAVLTSHVMDSISRLPGVATLDWADRAAAALTRLHHPTAVLCTLARLDQRGFIASLELTGAAASDPSQRVTTDEVTGRAVVGNAGGPPGIASTNDLSALRDSVKPGEWAGWNIGQLLEGVWFVATASQQGLIGARGPSPLSKRWEWLNCTEILLAAISVPAHTPGRMMLLEIATTDPAMRDSTREQAVLAATLPMLRSRLTNAFGLEEDDKHRWLTPREEMVLWHLVAGKKVPQIAAELHRSVYTVHDHVKSLHRKLNASNRGQLVSRALGHLGPLSVSEPAPPESPAGGKDLASRLANADKVTLLPDGRAKIGRASPIRK